MYLKDIFSSINYSNINNNNNNKNYYLNKAFKSPIDNIELFYLNIEKVNKINLYKIK